MKEKRKPDQRKRAETDPESELWRVAYWLEARVKNPDELIINEDGTFRAVFRRIRGRAIGDGILILQQEGFIRLRPEFMSAFRNEDGTEDLEANFEWTLQPPVSLWRRLLQRLEGGFGHSKP